MKIMIMTDMEGVAGILNFNDWVFPGGRYYEKGRRFLTNEVNAAVKGFFDGGADEIIVIDGHGAGGIDPELLDARAILNRGHYERIWPWGLDESFAALAYVGQHAKAGTPYSHMTHTQNTAVIDCRINDISVGEYGQLVLCAMELGIPTILACGEEAFVHEAEALTSGVIGVGVKRGLLPDDGHRNCTAEEYADAKLSAEHYSAATADKMIYEGALEAISKLKNSPHSFRYPLMSPPYKIVWEYRASSVRKTAAAVTAAEHSSSIIELLNL